MREWREEIDRRLSGSGLAPSEEADVAEELAQHVEDRYAELRSRGMTHEEARRRALDELVTEGGTLASVVSAVRGGGPPDPGPIGADGGPGFLGDLGGDVRYAVRSLRRSPGYTAVVLLTLALGLGSVSAMQAVIQPVLIRPLAFPAPERLVTLDAGLIPGEYEIIRERATAFERTSLVRPGTAFGLSGDGEPERVRGSTVTPELFATLAVRPLAGGLPEVADAGAGGLAVLSYELWQRRFGGDPDVVGRSITLDGRPVPVVAVMPRGFSYPSRTQLWLAEPIDRTDMGALWGSGGYRLVGRLHRDAGVLAAEAEVRALSDELSAANPFWTPSADYRSQVRVVSLHEALVGDVSRALWLLGAAVTFLLLIACANVGNLVLARGLGRTRELAIRTALGASGGRVVRQLLTETMVLAMAGGLAGIAAAFLAVRALRGILPPDLPRLEDVGLDMRVLAAALAITALTGLLLGVLPARRATRFDLQASLRDGGRATGDRSGRRLSSGLVVAQVALAVVLVSGAGLLGRSLALLHGADTGIGRVEVVTARLDLPSAVYRHTAHRNAFYDDLLARLAALPGVRSAAATSQLPFSGQYQGSAMAVEHVTTDPNNLPMFVHRRVTSEFFDALGIPLHQGRLFTASDAAPDGLPVAIVDEAAAREFWPGEDPIGKRLGRPWLNELLVVVGVVGSVLDGDLAGRPERTVYTPMAKEPPHSAFVVMHAVAGMRSVPMIRDVLRDLDPAVPLSDAATVETLVAGTLAGHRLSTTLLAGFGMLALLLAAIGIYGVLAYGVAQRGRELALRLALGARGADLLWLVLGQGLRLAGIGMALGLLTALGLGRLLAGTLHGVQPRDPLTFGAVTAVVLLAAACAVAIPARRASRVEPMAALRD